MLSVSVHKDITEYTEKVAGKLSARTLACVAGGLATSVAAAAALNLALGVQPSDATLPVAACSMPFWLAGFWRPHGLKAEEFLRLWLAHARRPGPLVYRPTSLPCPWLGGAARDRAYAKRMRRKGAEARAQAEER